MATAFQRDAFQNTAFQYAEATQMAIAGSMEKDGRFTSTIINETFTFLATVDAGQVRALSTINTELDNESV